MGTSDASISYAGNSTPTFNPVCAPVGSDEYGTLILDCLGRICGGGSVAGSVFGAGQSLNGWMISAFIPDILAEGSSDPESPAPPCESSDWHRFNAKDILGRGFDVEVRVSRKMTHGKPVFVLNFYRPGRALFEQTSQ
jgi:hypothetical protein